MPSLIQSDASAVLLLDSRQRSRLPILIPSPSSPGHRRCPFVALLSRICRRSRNRMEGALRPGHCRQIHISMDHGGKVVARGLMSFNGWHNQTTMMPQDTRSGPRRIDSPVGSV